MTARWLKDWKNIAAAIAIAASTWASVRGEMATGDANSAESKATKAQKEADNNATAILAVLNQRLDDLEEAEKEIRVYMAAMDQRDKYLEKMLWEIYRSERGARAADRVVSEAPAKPDPPPLVSRKRDPMPKSAADAKAQYQEACDAGDPLCAVALE